jgi:hypothetical protein
MRGSAASFALVICLRAEGEDESTKIECTDVDESEMDRVVPWIKSQRSRFFKATNAPSNSAPIDPRAIRQPVGELEEDEEFVPDGDDDASEADEPGEEYDEEYDSEGEEVGDDSFFVEVTKKAATKRKQNEQDEEEADA